MDHKSRKIFLAAGIAFLISVTIELVFGQSVITEKRLEQEKYTAKKLYRVTMTIDPTIIQVIADPRFSSEFYPMYELVYMASNPRSEIRRLPELMNKISVPESWQIQTNIVTDQSTISHPNKVGILPDGTVGKQSRYVWWVASGLDAARYGFTNFVGGIFLINMAISKWRPIPVRNSTSKFYTHTEWIDMDIDGHKDCITVEGSHSESKLIWLQQPKTQTNWIEHVISGNDNVGGTEFRLMQLPSSITQSVQNVFIVAGKTTGKLTAYWVEDADNDWSREKKIRSLEIASDGAYVGLEIVDLNIDGRMEILTSTSAVAGRRGSVLAYEYPKDGFDNGEKWRKHILSEWHTAATNFRTLSPGPVTTFTVQSRVAGRSHVKPHILVSGVDDGKVYVLSPASWSPFIWDYNREVIWSSNKKVGTPAVSDIDGNGEVEIFIPSDFSISVLRYTRSAGTTARTSLIALSSLAIVPSLITAVLYGSV